MQRRRDRLGLRVPAEKVSPRALIWWGLRGALWTGLVRLVLWVLERELPQYSQQYWDPLITVVYVVGFVAVFVVPPIRYQIQRWEVGAEALFVRDGLLTVALRIAPFSRVQTVATKRGPLEMLLGLSTVIVSTASSMGPLRMVGLNRDLAIRLETEISERAEAARSEAV